MGVLDDMEKKIVSDAKQRLEVGSDSGHIALVSDAVALLEEVETLQFHDFLNTKYATPKVKLVAALSAMIEKCKNGNYDN